MKKMSNERLKEASLIANVLLLCAPGVGLLIAMRQTAMSYLLPPWFDSIGTPAMILGSLFMVFMADRHGEFKQAVIGVALMLGLPSVLPMLVGEAIFTMDNTASKFGLIVAVMLVAMPWVLGLACLLIPRRRNVA